jgi:hypothetical protein
MLKILASTTLMTTLMLSMATAQNATEETPPSTTEAAAAAPPEPEYNGTASGSAAGSTFSVPVVCEGFGAQGPVTVKSDPNDAAGGDANGDGTVVNISASPDGSITLDLLNANQQFNLSDSSAELTDTSLSYQIEMTFSGGLTESIDLTADCQ